MTLGKTLSGFSLFLFLFKKDGSFLAFLEEEACFRHSEKVRYNEFLEDDSSRSSCVVQQVKDLALSLLWLWLQLWHVFDLWPRNFHMLQAWPKIKKMRYRLKIFHML